MATLKQRLHRKNSSGTYDTVHLESSSDLILRPSGRTVEQDLADYLPQVQNNDNVPQSLLFGTFKTPWEWVLKHILALKNRGSGTKTVKIACFLTPSLGVSGRC